MKGIEKQRNIVDFTLSSLLRRKGKNLSLLIVYALIVFVLSSVMFLTHSIKREASIVLREAPGIIVQRTVAGRHDLMPLANIEKIRSIKGVTSVKGRLWGYYYDPISRANYTLIVPEGFLYGSGYVAIGSGVARVSLSREGEVLTFRTYDGVLKSLRIKEVITSESELVSSDLIQLSEADFRRLFGIPEEYVTDVTLEVKNSREVTTVANKIVKLIPDARPIIREEILRTYEAVFGWRSGIMLAVLSGAVLAFVIFAWDKASGLSEEEKREIGILKALGWETSDVILMKFWEGIVVSLLSFLLGVILAYVHVYFTSSSFFAPVLKGWSVLYPDFRAVPFVDFYQMTALFFFTVVPYTVATIIPSWRAATIEPDSVMRA